MNFLAPLFLIGSLAVGLPLLFHLIRRTTRERKPFSSLMFLVASPPRLTRRSRLEHLLLLLLRCLVVCLLAFAFARPFFNRAVLPPAATAVRRLVLLDTSASMRRAGLWADARARAEAVIRNSAPADQVAVYTFEEQLRPLVTFEQWNATAPAERAATARAKIAAVTPGWLGTRTGNALMQAAELLADTRDKTAQRPGELVLISDMQQGSHLEAIQGYEWPRGVKLLVDALKPKFRDNASLQVLADPDDSTTKAAAGVRVRVTNNADSKREQFQLAWTSASGSMNQPVSIYVPAGQSRTVTMPLPAEGADRLQLQGDADDFDNTVWVVPPETQRLNVLYLGSDRAGDATQPLYFLQRAFQETRRRAVTVVARSAQSAATPAEFNDATLLVIPEPLPDALASQVREQVVSGKTAFVMLNNAGVCDSVSRALQIPALNCEEVRSSTYALLGEIDFRDPIFAPFADPRFSDFSKIHFWKYRKVDINALPGARVLARFDSGDPALIQWALGKGRLLILASGWQPQESQLALSTKFVPLLYSILEQSGAPALLPPQFRVGETIPLGMLGAHGTAVTVHSPDGSQVQLPAGATNFTGTSLPGVYTADLQPVKRFAVNLDPAESLTMPVGVDELERLGAPVARAIDAPDRVAARQVQLAKAELESRQKLWRWVVICALAVLVGEMWLGGWTARREGSRISGAAPAPDEAVSSIEASST